MANFAAADLDGLVRIVKRKLRKIQYRPHLMDGCLTGTGLTIELLVAFGRSGVMARHPHGGGCLIAVRVRPLRPARMVRGFRGWTDQVVPCRRACASSRARSRCSCGMSP